MPATSPNPPAPKLVGLNLLTSDDVCRILGIGKRTLIRYANKGRLSRVKLSVNNVRYDPDDVKKLIRSNTHRG